jgi:hypothetical protein
MRNAAKRQKVKTLFILGAGASKSLTQINSNSERITPLDIEFTQRIEQLDCKVKHKWVNEAKEKVIHDFLYHVPFKEFGLERAISQQISDLDFLKSIFPRRGRKTTNSLEYLENITHLISFVLSKGRFRDERLVQKIIDKYFNYTNVSECPNRIITFNYDTLIDDLLYKKFKNYGHLYFDSISPKRNSRSRVKYKYPLLLKLHGSINWRCIKSEYQKIFASPIENKKSSTTTFNTSKCHFIDEIWIDKKIENPGNDIFPLIIPPIPDKPITNVAIFKYLWSYAFEYLTECEEIVVSGYSLPETDTLATSLFSKFDNTKLKKVVIVDPSPNTVLKWVNLFNRKGIKNLRIEYFTDFSQYLKEL